MEEIGSKLKEKREENGVTIEEAAEDLKLRPSQISDIEEGNIKNFSDVFYLKYFIRDYAKYLGMDSNKVLDEFNEFLFDYTSKIPVKKIEEAKKEKKNDIKKVISPYTINKKEKIQIPSYVIYIVIAILVVIIGYILISNYSGDDFNKDEITYIEKR